MKGYHHMNATICDRCGRTFKFADETEYTYEAMVTKGSIPSVRINKCPDSYSYDLDLCPECTEKLRKWIAEGMDRKT